MPNDRSAPQLREETVQLIDDLLAWSSGASESHGSIDAKDLQHLQGLRTRASSVLLKVGLLGSFSSGKTFLVNALQGHLEYFERSRRGRRKPSVQYIGLLPSSPEPTTAAPTTLRPVRNADEGDSAVLRVRFAGDEFGTWTVVGDASPGRIAAYTTEIKTDRENAGDGIDSNLGERERGHRNLEVAEAEIEISKYELDVLLFDLPGVHSPTAAHSEISRMRMNDADCFIYVTSAVRVLSEEDLEQIRELLNHFRDRGGKPIIWVMTAIDLGTQEESSGEEKWKITLRTNNDYLDEHFGPEALGPMSADFIGRGFIGVSPALEAEAKAIRDEDPAESDELQAESQMNQLRERIVELTAGSSGMDHVNHLAAETLTIARTHVRRVEERFEDEKKPLDKLREEIETIEHQIREREDERGELATTLRRDLESSVRTSMRSFDKKPDLGSYLHIELDGLIDRTDFRRPKEVNRYEVTQNSAIREWLEGVGRPLPEWSSHFPVFFERANEGLRRIVGSDLIHSGGQTLDLNDLERLLAARPWTPPDPDTVNRVVDMAAKITPLASFATVGGGATATVLASGAAATAGVALIPLGLILGGASLYSFRQRRGEAKSHMDVWRAEEKQALDSVASEVQALVTAQAIGQGEEVIDLVGERIALAIDDMNRRRLRLETRQRDKSTQASKEVVEELADRVAEGQRIVSGLSQVVLSSGSERQTM